jgi:UDP-N-acetylmuramoyl-tripeptide--D-alanyl-D-alanine ligase
MTQILTLAALIEALAGRRPENLAAPVRPVIDSRQVGEPGSIFFAFEGEHVDGHDYVGDALARGAIGAVIERDVQVDAGVTHLDLTAAPDQAVWELPADARPPLLIKVPDVLSALQGAARWWRQQLGLRVVGITGSVGKTTTKEIAGRVLSQRYAVTWSRGSYNNEIGLPLTLLALTGDCERLVQEMGMYVRGDIRFLAELARPDVGVLTNVAPVHAERAGTIDEIALGKRELVEALPPAPRGVAILNADDARVRAMAAHTPARVLTYGLSTDADLWAEDVEVRGLAGLRATLRYGDVAAPIEMALLGRHSIYGALCGAAVGLVEGLTWDEIVAGLASVDDPLRLVAVEGSDGILILDDTYNSSPPSALAALDLLSELEGRKVAVLGDMLELGKYEAAGHWEVGARAAEVVAELVVVGDLGPLIAEGAVQHGLAAGNIYAAPNSEVAVDLVRQVLQPEDVVLVKGSRGVAMEQIVAALTCTDGN